MPSDPYKYFRVEAAELGEQLTRGALAIDKGASIPGGLAALLRQVHTLKGAARVVRQSAIAEHAHAIEDLLAPHRSPGADVPERCASEMLSHLDAIGGLLQALGSPPAADAGDGSTRSADAATATQTAPAAARRELPDATEPALEPLRVLRTDVRDVDALLDGLGEALAELSSMRGSFGGLEQSLGLTELLAGQLAAPRRGAVPLTGGWQRVQQISDDLSAGLRRFERGLRQGAERLGRELAQVHASAERLRLVPANSMFAVLERLVREETRTLGKSAAFEATGGDVRLDGHVLAVAQNAMSHAVRNAVAHGLEPASERASAGKSETGTIRLGVERQGRHVVFSVSDDGAGADPEAIREALRRDGVDASGLSHDQLLAALLRAGISTASQVTRLAGRGVGLDVVREAAERLGGFVRLGSRPGLDFRLELHLPLSLAGVVALVVECEGQNVAVPLEAVETTVRLAQADITRTRHGDSVCHEGRLIPFAPLSRALSGRAGRPRDAWSSLIVRGGNAAVAVGVDRLLGPRALVLRPLPEMLRAPLVAGAALDALGNPELVLDAEGLVAAVRAAAGIEASTSKPPAPVLVIDDSLTTRMLERSILESAGYDVELATSGEEGLQKALQGNYSLFLVDVEMPGIDGFTFIDRARSTPQIANVPSVLVSSRSSPEDLQRGKSVGAKGYIVKGSFDQEALLGLIRELVGT